MDSRLYKCAKSRNISLLKQLINENPGSLLKLTPHENTALHIAVRFGHKEMVAEIYSRYPCLLVQPNLDGDTPLHIAARAGLVSIIDYLVTQILGHPRVIIEILRMENQWKNTVLHEAVKYGHVRVVELLLWIDYELACFVNEAGESPLYLAASEGMEKIVNQILSSTPSSAHGGSRGQTALHAAIAHGHLGIVKSLLNVKQEIIKETDNQRRTALHYAASNGDHRTSRELLKLDTSLAYMLDKEGASPLHVAASKGHTKIVQVMIDYCPDSGELKDLSGRNALHTAVVNRKVNVVRYMLERVELEGLINQADNNGNTPFHLAAIEQNTSIINHFIWSRRVDRRAVNKSGQTPIDIDQLVKETNFFQILISSMYRQLRTPRTWLIRAHGGTSAEAATMQTYHQMAQTLLVVAALITTVTFAAAFTMPGGYSNQGMALLHSSKYLKQFIMSDTIAMSCSITAACVIFWGMITDSKTSYVYYLSCAAVLTYIALQSTAIAFATGVLAVIPNTHFLKTTWLVIGSAFHVTTLLFLLRLLQIFSMGDVYHFVTTSLYKIKSKFVNRYMEM